jgi:hypothetical protein
MAIQETSSTKERIISFIKRNGPILPVHIAKEMNLSILFASAFLSELVSERKIKISYMKVGSSPIYFIPGQEFLLEKFSEYLKSREKEAFLLLKQKKFLKDENQEPAIKVALRQIKDYAIPFKNEYEEIYWRYFKVNESDFKEEKSKKIEKEETKKEDKKEERKEDKKEETKKEETKEKKSLDILNKPKTKKIPKEKGRKISQKQNDRFFNKIKEYLNKKSIEILDIESFSKNDLFLRINQNESEKLLAAFNKKRINEKDILKANKKALELDLNYIILSLGEPLKKLTDLIEAIKRLSNIERIE